MRLFIGGRPSLLEYKIEEVALEQVILVYFPLWMATRSLTSCAMVAS